MMDAENTLTLETTKGKVVILMRPDLAPGHVFGDRTLEELKLNQDFATPKDFDYQGAVKKAVGP